GRRERPARRAAASTLPATSCPLPRLPRRARARRSRPPACPAGVDLGDERALGIHRRDSRPARRTTARRESAKGWQIQAALARRKALRPATGYAQATPRRL